MTQTTMLSAMGFGERVGYSGMMLLIGMGTIFAVLAILWGALEIFHRIVEARSKATASAAPAAPAAPAKVQQTAPVAQDDGALIAVITAAVAATMADENGGEAPAFRVVSFRRL